MTELLSRTANLGTSRPIFELQLRDNGSISINENYPVHKFTVESKDGEILQELVASHYREQFNKLSGTFYVDKEGVARSCMNSIRDTMSLFLEKNLNMRSPKQSKIYRWTYRAMPHTREFEDVLVMVYKYMRTFCNSSMIAYTENKEEHVKNTIALLEALQEKYGK